MAFNGSPRENWNTAKLLKKALEGAADAGAETEFIHLYSLSYKGCCSCFSCKLIGGASYGRCAVQDELTPVLERAEKADILFFGSPIYFGDVTGEMRQLLERMLFAHFAYDPRNRSLWPKKTQGAIIYTMGSPVEGNLHDLMARFEESVKIMLGSVTTMSALDTYQFSDYSKYYAPMFNAEHKKRHYEEVFPQDCRKAYELGRSLVQESRQAR